MSLTTPLSWQFAAASTGCHHELERHMNLKDTNFPFHTSAQKASTHIAYYGFLLTEHLTSCKQCCSCLQSLATFTPPGVPGASGWSPHGRLSERMSTPSTLTQMAGYILQRSAVACILREHTPNTCRASELQARLRQATLDTDYTARCILSSNVAEAPC